MNQGFICRPNDLGFKLQHPEKYTRLAMFLSGGADSAILMYLLVKIIVNTGHRCSLVPYTIPRTDGAATYSPDIVLWIRNKLDVWIHEPIMIGDPALDHTIVVRNAVQQLLSSNSYDAIYLAENKIPDLPVSDYCLPPVRTVPNPNSKVKFPFVDLTKDNIIDLYFQEGVEQLLALTHSCTEMTKYRCHKCFNCLERAWAFKQLGEIDPGVL